MKNKKFKFALTSCFLATGVIACVVLGQSNSSFLPGRAADHTCYGNHYDAIKANETENGCNEYWVCCECHEKYYSTLEIPSYDPAKWVNSGEYQRFDDEEDPRHVGSLFNKTIAKDGCGFTANGNVLTGSATNDGWIVSEKQYYNFSMDVVVDKASVTNPYWDHLITNAIIIGGQINSGLLSGYVIQIDKDYLELFYLDSTYNPANYAGDCIVHCEGNFSNKTINISVNKDRLRIVADGAEILTYDHLTRYDYQTAGNPYSTNNIVYNGGHIGLYNYGHQNDANIRGSSLTVTNFSNNSEAILNDTIYSNGNWKLSSDKKQVQAGATDYGWMLTNEYYEDVELRVKPDKGSEQNIWGTHVAYNSIIIGGKYENNALTGYVVELQNNHCYIAKLSGNGYNTGDVVATLGHWGDGGTDFATANKNIFISVSGKTLTVTAIDEIGRAAKHPLYPSVSYTMEDYTGGSIGYLSQNEGAHNVIVEELTHNNASLDVVKGVWDVATGSYITSSSVNLALIKDKTLENGSFSAKMKANGTNNSGIVFNASNDGTSYYTLFMTSNGGNQLKLHKVVNGTSTELATCYVTAGYAYTHEITLTIEFYNGDFKCFFNDKMLHARVDESPLTGNRVGLYSENSGSSFSNDVTSTQRNFKTVDTLIIGHSYMELWSNYKTDLSKYTDIANIGIGGTASNDWIGHRSEVKAFAPNRLIYMIGINDVPRGTSATDIVNNIKSLINGVMEDLPETEICLLSVNRCVTHETYKDVIAETNTLMKTYVSEHEQLHYGDLDSAFLNTEGNPDSACFTDGLHPTAESYEVIANAIYAAFGD